MNVATEIDRGIKDGAIGVGGEMSGTKEDDHGIIPRLGRRVEIGTWTADPCGYPTRVGRRHPEHEDLVDGVKRRILGEAAGIRHPHPEVSGEDMTMKKW